MAQHHAHKVSRQSASQLVIRTYRTATRTEVWLPGLSGTVTPSASAQGNLLIKTVSHDVPDTTSCVRSHWKTRTYPAARFCAKNSSVEPTSLQQLIEAYSVLSQPMTDLLTSVDMSIRIVTCLWLIALLGSRHNRQEAVQVSYGICGQRPSCHEDEQGNNANDSRPIAINSIYISRLSRPANDLGNGVMRLEECTTLRLECERCFWRRGR